MAEKEDQDEQTIANDLVVTKYKMAAEMVNGGYSRNSKDNTFGIFLCESHDCVPPKMKPRLTEVSYKAMLSLVMARPRRVPHPE